MQGFSGFPQKGYMIKVPGLFFSELLPHIDDLAELKVTLYCFWRLQQKEGQEAYLRRSEFLADKVFMGGLGAREDERRSSLLEGLERAVARGTLLHVCVHRAKQDEDLYFVNTPRGRAAVSGIERGVWLPEEVSGDFLDLNIERPNIFVLYEQNIGPLTPILAERLRDIEESYPPNWFGEAIQTAVEHNVRKLAYIEGILRRWRDEGRGDDTSSDRARDWRRFVSGKYKDEIDH